MMPQPPHLSWDDLDDLLMGTESHATRVHLETCPECPRVASLDLEVVVQLQRLPELSPSPGFADRVIEGGRVLRAPAVPVRGTWLRAAGIAALILGGLASSAAWSLANQPLLLSWQAGALTAVSGLVGVGIAVVEAVPQSTVVSFLRKSVGGVGVGLILTMMASAYLAGVLSLQRLLSLPIGPERNRG
jgi:hypothetical protein